MKPPPGSVEQFKEDGYVIIPQFLPRQGVERALAAMERVYRGEYNDDRRPARIRKPVATLGSQESVHWVLNARILDRDLWGVATDPEIGEAAATLLGTPSVSIVEDQLLAKPPGGLPVNVHQDYSYWPFSRSTQMITAWIALSDMALDMGPVQVLRGSHRWGPAPRPRELIEGSELDWLSGIESVRPAGAEIELVTADVPAGGAVFFHSLAFHGSQRNASERWRYALSLHWASEECRVDLAATAAHDYPYFFARLQDDGPLVNNYMPIVYPPPGQA